MSLPIYFFYFFFSPTHVLLPFERPDRNMQIRLKSKDWNVRQICCLPNCASRGVWEPFLGDAIQWLPLQKQDCFLSLVTFLQFFFKSLTAVYFYCIYTSSWIQSHSKTCENQIDCQNKILWLTNVVIFLGKLYLSISSIRAQKYKSALLPS